ncbi:MAG: hypothetical protein NVS3B2_07160 [Ramlibacter sp.]
MTGPQPVAARPLALLTLAVLGAHLLLLNRAALRESPRPAGMRTLVTRLVDAARPPAPAQGVALARPTVQERGPQARVRPPSRATARPPAPAQEPATAAPAAIPESAVAPESASPPAPPMAVAIPGSMRLRYAVAGVSRGQAWNVPGELLWRHDGSQYEASLAYSAPTVPPRSQRSTGRITAEGLEPKRFSDQGRGEQATHFERERGTLVFSSNAPQQPLLPGAQDRLSVLLQLASMVAGAPEKFTAGTSVTVQTAGTRDAPSWLFTVAGDEPLELPGGRVLARKLTRQAQREYDLRIELWLGIDMDYVPVRIRLTQPNGDYVDQQWTSTDRS